MPLSRRLLHVVTALAVAVGVWVALRTDREDSTSPSAEIVSRAQTSTPTTTTTIAIESFAPSISADTFEVHPVAPRVPVPAPPAPSTSRVAPTTAPASPSVPSSDAGVVTAQTTDVAPQVVAPQVVAPQVVAPQVVARLERAASVYANAGDRAPVGSLAKATEFGTPRVLPVAQLGGDWMRVELPTRPNGSLGWIHTRDVTLASVPDRVDVDLAARTLTWTRDGAVQLTSTVGVGAPLSPTPTGNFFVTDVLPYPAGSEYGAWVVALDGHSEAFTEFEGGDARYAIHGTNDPSSIGRAASNGCVRVPDDVLRALAGALRAGTPVTVH